MTVQLRLFYTARVENGDGGREGVGGNGYQEVVGQGTAEGRICKGVAVRRCLCSVVSIINHFIFKALIFWEKVKVLLGFES
jgi:hypothetical protein